MPPYAEIILNCEFNGNTPANVIAALRCLISDAEIPYTKCLDTEDLSQGLLSSSKLNSFGSMSSLRYEEVNGTYYLLVHIDIKDSNGEIDRFLDWIAPYSKRQGFVGYIYIAEFEIPRLIFFINGKVLLTDREQLSL